MRCPTCGESEISLRFAVYYEQRVFSFEEDGTPRDVGDWFAVESASLRSAAGEADCDRAVREKIAARAGAVLTAHPDREYACDACGETFSRRLPVPQPPAAPQAPLSTPPIQMPHSNVVIAGIAFPLTLSGDSITVWSLRERLEPISLLAVFGVLAERGIPLRDSGIPVGSVRAAVARVAEFCGPAAVRPARSAPRAAAVRATREWFSRAVGALESAVGRWSRATPGPRPRPIEDVLAWIRAIAARGADNGDAYAALQQIEGLAEGALSATAPRPCVVIYTSGGVVGGVSASDAGIHVIVHDQDDIDAGGEVPSIPAGLVDVW